jgi:site-specific DNA-methyltransferase (adenine-specific)
MPPKKKTPFTMPAQRTLWSSDPALSTATGPDNKRGAIEALLTLNKYYRENPWPAPFDATAHRLHLGDARDLSWMPDESVHLVVTSPPYWTLKEYQPHKLQMGAIEDYEVFLEELDKAWAECRRILVPGGRICCVIGDVCMPRRKGGRHYVVPLHADIEVRARKIGLDCLTPILWFKTANGAAEARGKGAGFCGKPYQPGAVIKNDIEYILFLRKGTDYRSPSTLQKALSMLTKKEMRTWLRSAWTDIKGESRLRGHPAPFPQALAERLIRMFSFAGDTVLDPFLGTGTTSVAAAATGRNSIGNEVDNTYLDMAWQRMEQAIKHHRFPSFTVSLRMDDQE